MNIMIGIFMTVLGAIGSISTLLNIANDPYYTYTAPFSKHETTMMTLFFISFIIFCVGLVILILSYMKNKNQNKLNEIMNINGTKSDGSILVKNKCPNCNLNLSENCTFCPNCGQKIK